MAEWNPYSLKKPCANCPFLKDKAKAIELHPERVPSIVNDLLTGESTGFSCHKTLAKPPALKWKPVVGYEGLYEVSSYGQIRNSATKKILSTDFLSQRYERVGLAKDGNVKRFSLHRIVATAFHGSGLTGQQVRHLDGDTRNNQIDNLKWGSAKENADDRRRHGTTARGSAQHLNTLSEKDVLEIKEALKTEVKGQKGRPGTVAILAKKYNVSRGQIYSIKNGLSWSWLGEPQPCKPGWVEDENGEEHYEQSGKEKQCAGSLIVMQKLGVGTQLMQVMRRLDVYKPDDFKPFHDLIIEPEDIGVEKPKKNTV